MNSPLYTVLYFGIITEYEQLLSTKAPTTAVQTTVKSVQHAEDLKGLLGETDNKEVPISAKPANDVQHEPTENTQTTEKKDKPKITENKSSNNTALDSTENEVWSLSEVSLVYLPMRK